MSVSESKGAFDLYMLIPFTVIQIILYNKAYKCDIVIILCMRKLRYDDKSS
jgi:hypothetical protein